MNKLFSLIRLVFQYDFKEILNALIIKPLLKNEKSIEKFYSLNKEYDNICQKYYLDNNSSSQNSIGYDWGSWSGKIRNSFKSNVPINFLANQLIAFTMVYQRNKGVKETHDRLKYIKKIFSLNIMQKILLEDFIGEPVISNSFFKTSANRTHHTLHLASYYESTQKYFWESTSIIEFGGGYGNMARIIRKMNPEITYIIVDLPELLALQYVYLGSLETAENINVVSLENKQIQEGKINLVSSDMVYSQDISLNAKSFISTWALSECPCYLQKFVIEHDFFTASNILIASLVDSNNCMVDVVKNQHFQTIKVPFLSGNHEYWMK